MDKIGIGIIGAGNISGAYLKAMLGREGLCGFAELDVRAIADMRPETAAARAAEFGIATKSVEDLIADPDIGIVVNLTIPRAHVEVGLRVLEAGKHVYAEKPLGVSFAEGRRLVERAEALGLRVGSAPDTFLGAGHQQARQVVDSGALGQIVGGTAYFMCPGHERWHPDPAFYYDVGGGPVLDMAPYYITDLVNLIGPVERVVAMGSALRQSREILSEPRRGQTMDVKVLTHVAGLLEFSNGAIVQVGMSFDVAAHRHLPIELYGTEATLSVPDPNHFGGVLEMRAPGEADWTELDNPLPYGEGNYRSLGVADMARAILSGTPHRASGQLALHVLEVMEAFAVSATERRPVEITTTVERPAPL